MSDFDPEKFEEKYVHYFEELETAYSRGYERLHGTCDSTVLKAVDRQVLAESEPVYDGNGEFTLVLPENPYDRVSDRIEQETFEQVLDDLTEAIETELQQVFGFE